MSNLTQFYSGGGGSSSAFLTEMDEKLGTSFEWFMSLQQGIPTINVMHGYILTITANNMEWGRNTAWKQIGSAQCTTMNSGGIYATDSMVYNITTGTNDWAQKPHQIVVLQNIPLWNQVVSNNVMTISTWGTLVGAKNVSHASESQQGGGGKIVCNAERLVACWFEQPYCTFNDPNLQDTTESYISVCQHPAYQDYRIGLNLTGAKLNAASVSKILRDCANNLSGNTFGTLYTSTIDLSGGTSAGASALTTEGTAAKNTLVNLGFTVTLNP